MTIRVGLVGLGMMGTTHFKSYQEIPEARVVALCDVDPKKLAGDWAGAAGNIDTGAARSVDLGGLRLYSNYAKFMRDAEVDVVDICLPTFLHDKIALKALAAGKHVICEKPMALKSGRARRMVEAAARAGRFLAVAHVLRFWPEYVAIKEIIDSGRYGRVRSARFSRLSARPLWSWDNWIHDPNRSGSAVLDLHIHDTDMVQWLFGRPAKVTSHGTFDPSGGISHIVSAFHYQDGPLAVAEGGWDLPPSFPFRMAARLVFEQAAVEFSSLRSPTLVVHDAATGKAETPAVPAASGYTEELRYFIGCIAAGRPPTRVTPADAANAVALVEAEVKSALRGRTVKIKA